MFLRFICFFALSLWATPALFSQNTPDTLALVRNLRSSGKVRQASELLRSYTSAHPPAADVWWLYAQNEFWRKKFKSASRLYERAIRLQPDNLYLKLDFADALLNMGHFKSAHIVLQSLNRPEQLDPYSRLVEARYYYWTGDFNTGLKMAKAALKMQKPEEALALHREIGLAKMSWAGLDLGVTNDDQPIFTAGSALSAGRYLNRFFDVGITGSVQHFRTDSSSVQTTALAVSDKIRLQATRTEIELGGGWFRQDGHSDSWTALLNLRQPLPAALALDAGYNRGPYLHTVSSLGSNVFYQGLSAALEWHEPHGFEAQAGAGARFFNDKNTLSDYYGWVLSPALRGRFSLRAGYAFHYADARENKFMPVKSLQQLLNPYDSTAAIAGIYAPYFTPNEQRAHAVLVQADLKISDRLSLSAKGNYGFFASVQAPYFYLDTRSDGALSIQRGFSKQDYHPLDAVFEIGWQPAEKIHLNCRYQYTKNYFYAIQSAALGLKMLFGDGK